MIIKVKAGDALVPISGSIPLNLISGSAFFVAKNRESGQVVRHTASIHDPVNGGVGYVLTADDLSSVGRFWFEWEGHAESGEILTDPSGAYHELYVNEDLR